MARNVVKRGTAPAPEGAKSDEGQALDKAPMQGGSPGELDDPNPKSDVIHGLNDVAPAREHRATEHVPQKRYMVVGGPDSVMYEGARVRMNHGKVYNEGSVDLDVLRRQGVQLKELDEDAA